MPISRADVCTLTAKGNNELKGGATALEAGELELMVLVDGRRQVSGISGLVKSHDIAQVEASLQSLLRRGFIRLAAVPDAAEGTLEYFLPPVSRSPSVLSEQSAEHVAEEAAAGALTLRDHGYYVSIARRARTTAPVAARQLTVLVVEDEPLVARYLKALVEMEGHTARMAANREEIIAALRTAPLPDLAILDVMLPDTNGFDVLQSMKSNPKIAEVPVMMVTMQATRESVMKGLALGADGYFTKPFEVDILLRGMKAVLGLLPPAQDAGTPLKDPRWSGE